MDLSFRQPAPLALVRDFCADLVRLLRPGIGGEWTLVSSTPRPHHWLSPLPDLAVMEWRLGEATLVQSVVGDEEGNPRDGYGFHIQFELAVAGTDGVVRTLSLADSGWEPFPQQLHFSLQAFTVDEWCKAREAGRARFANDETAQAIWAAQNVEAFLALGARSQARLLVEEALARPGEASARGSVRDLRRALVDLTDEPTARALAESRLLVDDPTDVARLERIAQGTLVLPSWTPRAAAHVLAVMQPWRPASAAVLGEVALRWFEHPWWKGTRRDGWSSLREQPALQPLPVSRAVQAARRALGITDVDLSFRHLRPAVRRASDGLLRGLDGDSARVRAVVHSRERADGFEHHWTWLWTGEGLEGAVLVSRLALPLDEQDEPVPVDTHLAWLGGEAARARFTAALLEQSELFRLGPAAT